MRKMRHTSPVHSLLAGLALASVLTVIGTAQTGSAIKGVVRVSGTETPVANATVRFENVVAPDKSYSVVTDRKGKFSRRNLMPGIYRILVECDGYLPLEMSQVEIRSNEDLTLTLPIRRQE